MILEGKIALITGGASGIGRAGAELFAREGARVAIADVNAERLAAVVQAIRAAGGEAVGIEADLSRNETAPIIVAEAVAAYGGLDILWNNAGTKGPPEIEGLDIAKYDEAIALNLTTGVLASGEALTHMRRRGGGSIIFTSSGAGLVGALHSAVYSAAKFAVIGYVKSLAQRVALDGIRVNAICPGPVETEMLLSLDQASQAGMSGQAYLDRLVANVPLKRMAKPSEMAEAALWLASDQSSYVTGIALPVDGGLTCH